MSSADTARIDASALLAGFQAREIRLQRHGDLIKVSAPAGTLTSDDAALIRRHKAELLAHLGALGGERPLPIPSVSRDDDLPLGAIQQWMWAYQYMLPDTVLFHLPAAWRMRGDLDVWALEQALHAFVQRHDILSARFRPGADGPTQTIVPTRQPLPLHDLTDVETADDVLTKRLEALRDAPFDLEQGPLYRWALFRLSAHEHVLFFMPNHIIWDGWSFDIFLKELDHFYRDACGETVAPLPALPIRFVDYAAWQRGPAAQQQMARQLAYWTERLRHPPEPNDLPTDFARPRLFSHEGDWCAFTLDETALVRIRALGAECRATSFMVLLSAWFAFVSRLIGQTDLIVATDAQARQHPYVHDVVGCFVNLLCIRQTVDPDGSFASLIEAIRDVCIGAFVHQDVPPARIMEELGLRADPSRVPLFQTMFRHQQTAQRPSEIGDLSLVQAHINPAATPADLMFAVMEGEHEARAILHFSTELFERRTIDNLRARFRHFLQAALDDSNAALASLPMLLPDERQMVLAQWNDTDRSLQGTARIGDAFARHVALNPDAPAVTSGTRTLSYRDLDTRVGQLAGFLQSQGVEPGDLVGIHLERGIDTIASALALWRNGAGYVPLDPQFPADRLAYMVEHSGCRLILTDAEAGLPTCAETVCALDLDALAPSIEAARPLAFDHAPADPKARAYVLYTSGSTGLPKGVEIPHGAVVNFLESMAERPGLTADDRLLAVTTLSFDISVLELFLPLSVGAHVIISSPEDAFDIFALQDMIEAHDITFLQATPATWRLLLASDWQGNDRFCALCGGEPLPSDLAAALLPKVGALWNMYGPTETTIWSTCARIERADQITIGTPIANTQIYIVDSFGEPLAPGQSGELWIGGAGVATGYLHAPDLTSSRFFANPFSDDPDARIYRTGDWARWLPSGALVFEGRCDDQVKVRGYRIELGEIETALMAHADVKQAAIKVVGDRATDAAIVAYTVLHRPGALTASELRQHLRTRLPNYMLPQLFMELDALPLTNNNKINRKALPNPEGLSAQGHARVAPRTPEERLLAEIWCDLLGISEVSVTDNFFDLGGQSLQAAQMAARLRQHYDKRLSARAVIFETLEQLAAGLQRSAA